MSREVEAAEQAQFKVICTWCGVVIRRTSAKDSHGMCLKCYSRMLSERGCASWQTGAPPRTNEQSIVSGEATEET